MSRVLVIDDHEPSRAHLITILRECGYEIAGEGSSRKLASMLARLRCFDLRALYPGHGRISTTPIADIERAAANAQRVLDGKSEAGPEIFYRKEETDMGVEERLRS
jgi:hypothetical protein